MKCDTFRAIAKKVPHEEYYVFGLDKKYIYLVKRRLIFSAWEVTEGDAPQFQIIKKEVNLPDAHYYEKNDCALIAKLVREATRLNRVLPECTLTYPKICGGGLTPIDWQKTRRDHTFARHGLFLSHCPQTC